MYVWSWARSLVKKICQKEGAQIFLLCEMSCCYVETHASSLSIFPHTIPTILDSSVQVNGFLHRAREVILLYKLAFNCALHPLWAKKIYRTYCIPLCSWNQEEEGILAVQLLLGFVGLEGIRESLMEAADPGPAEQERENQTWNFF